MSSATTSAAEITWRRAGRADVAELAALARETYAEHFAQLWQPSGLHHVGGLKHYLDAQFGPDELDAQLQPHSPVRFYFVLRNGYTVGYVKLKLGQPVPAGGPPRTGLELEKMYFRRLVVGQGVGAAVMARVLAEAAALGAPLVWLDVLKANTHAMRFYERCGFRTVGELPFATDQRDISLWVMERAV